MDLLFQDCIAKSIKLERSQFVSWLERPVLVEVWRPGRLAFQIGGTRLSSSNVELPVARKILREGNHLPVLLLRQHLPGPRGTVRLGRSRDNDLVIDHDTVSARHAVFTLTEQLATSLRDVGSTNGTMVNGRRIVVGKELVIFDGDMLAFGDVGFMFFYPGGLYDILQACLAETGAGRLDIAGGP